MDGKFSTKRDFGLKHIRFYLGNRRFKDYLQTHEMDLKGNKMQFFGIFHCPKKKVNLECLVKFLVSQNTENFVTKFTAVSFLKRTVFLGIT